MNVCSLKKYFFFTLFIFFNSFLQAQSTIDSSAKNIVYAEITARKLVLDIYLSAGKQEPYLIVWIHGGAWRAGTKENPPLGLLQAGYALASVDFRLSTEAIFPGPVHDIKAAIRFLRGNTKKYGYRSDKIILWGASSGGHLAALVGTTNNDKFLEGSEGNYIKESSSVQGILDFYGPTNFTTILSQSTPHGLNVRTPALELLLGKPVEQVMDLAKTASPVYQVNANDPPILIVHGDQDLQVPINQSLELMAAYKKTSLFYQLEIIPGAGHGDTVYYQKEFLSVVEKFLNIILAEKY